VYQVLGVKSSVILLVDYLSGGGMIWVMKTLHPGMSYNDLKKGSVRDFKSGDKVKPKMGAGSHRTGIVVPMNHISTNERGIPSIPGAYKAMPESKGHVAIKYDDDGSHDIFHHSHLDHIG
jgi:hypothetical protein